MVLSFTSLRSLLTCYFIRCAFLASLFKKTNHPFHSPIYPVFLSCYIFLCRTLDLLSYYCCCCSVTQSYQTLCNPMNCSPQGSSVHGILQARTLKWVAAGSRSSAPGKGHEEGGSTYAKAGSSLRSPPGNSRASTSKTRVCLLYYFVLSPTPLTLHGAVPHHLFQRRS